MLGCSKPTVFSAAFHTHGALHCLLPLRSYRSAFESSMEALRQPTIRVVAVIAEVRRFHPCMYCCCHCRGAEVAMRLLGLQRAWNAVPCTPRHAMPCHAMPCHAMPCAS